LNNTILNISCKHFHICFSPRKYAVTYKEEEEEKKKLKNPSIKKGKITIEGT
jgi:hypothetical protein